MDGDPGERSVELVRGLSFGSVAEQYERYRMGYPDELVDIVVRHARRPVRSALEVGAGTGKASRLFASRGIEVTALEPDEEMARVLMRTTHGMPVRLVQATFEMLETARLFDLVYAAAAWHWTDPTTRWARAARLLARGGVLALFGRPTEPKDPHLAAAIDEIETQRLPGDALHLDPVPDDTTITDFIDTTRFDLRRVDRTTAADFVGRLATASAYLMLSPQARAEALAEVRALLPERFTINASVQIFLARRA